MDQIAQQAGVSKATIYKHFSGKEALFSHIALEKCDHILEPILNPGGNGNGTAESPPEDRLLSMAMQIFSVLLDDHSMDLYRLIMGEARKFPALGRTLYDSGPRRAIDRLAGWLEEQSRNGVLRVDNPSLAAAQFFGLISGTYDTRRLLIPDSTIDEAEFRAHAHRAIEIFLSFYRPAG